MDAATVTIKDIVQQHQTIHIFKMFQIELIGHCSCAIHTPNLKKNLEGVLFENYYYFYFFLTEK